jgi:cysteine-rich repeat protein
VCNSGLCQPTVCGNGIVEPGETCDDGHTTACGPCNATCTGPGSGSVCGDGTVCPDTEACDDGHKTACGACNATCTAAGTGSVCGDGVVCADTETCDDGHQTDCGPCNATCTGPGTGSVCGDGSLCPDTEACDDGDTLVCGTCNATCTGAGITSNCCLAPSSGNLIPNPGFDTNSVSAWQLFDVTSTFIGFAYSNVDATACSTSGSLLETNSAPNGLNSGIYYCLSVVPGQTFNVGGRVRVPSGGAQGQTFLDFGFLNGANCTGSFLGTIPELGATGPFDTWQYLREENVTAPAGAVSLEVDLALIKNFADTKSYQSYFDMLFVTPAPGSF